MLHRVAFLANGLFQYLLELTRSRRLILDLTRREFRSRFLGSAFGLAWAFVHPIVMMTIYFVVFRYCLEAGPVGSIPFLVWLLAGIVPWFLAQECIASGGNVVMDNRFLVKKVKFQISLLPVVRLLSLLPVHLVLVIAVSIICWIYGYPPSLATLQVFYYLFATFVLGLGLSWLLSAMVPFLRDLTQVVSVLIQVFFWLTPIAWPENKVPDGKKWILWLNPLYYIVNGYRDALVTHEWFWNHPGPSIYYWAVTLIFFFTGAMVFLRMKPHFADVL